MSSKYQITSNTKENEFSSLSLPIIKKNCNMNNIIYNHKELNRYKLNKKLYHKNLFNSCKNLINDRKYICKDNAKYLSSNILSNIDKIYNNLNKKINNNKSNNLCFDISTNNKNKLSNEFKLMKNNKNTGYANNSNSFNNIKNKAKKFKDLCNISKGKKKIIINNNIDFNNEQAVRLKQTNKLDFGINKNTDKICSIIGEDIIKKKFKLHTSDMQLYKKLKTNNLYKLKDNVIICKPDYVNSTTNIIKNNCAFKSIIPKLREKSIMFESCFFNKVNKY